MVEKAWGVNLPFYDQYTSHNMIDILLTYQAIHLIIKPLNFNIFLTWIYGNLSYAYNN